jgi:membrane-associated phospholipid phosphatase
MPGLRHFQRGAILAASFLVAVVLPAQDAAPPESVTSPASVSSPVSWKDARRLGVFTLAAVAAMPIDRDGQRLMQRRWVQDSPLLSHTADAFNAYGSPGVFAGSAALYVAGWAMGRPDIARLGVRAGEAIALSGVVTAGIKGIAGRARPYASPGAPGDWRLMSGVRGGGARQSFPSGHVTAAFAFATAMDRELRVSHPMTARWAGPSLYAAAALTGFARMHSDNHWASDVIMGAGVGTVSGLIVARFHADRPRHWIDRRLLPRVRR